MIQKTNTIKQKPEVSEVTASEVTDTNVQLGRDVMTAVLIVSVVANLFVLTTWIMLQVTSQYDSQLVSFFVNR